MTDGEKMVWAAAFVKSLDYSRATTPESAATAREIAMSYADGIVSMLRFTSYTSLWKLSPAANCPGLPVNGKRNEG